VTPETGLREALEGMVWQFAHRFARNGRRYLGTMGLSALEDAFAALGWNDPHPCDDEGFGCARPGCAEWATCGQPTPDGYEWLCSTHSLAEAVTE
jgi:hypothetical protein